MSLSNLIFQNKDAILALSDEVKLGILAVIALLIIVSAIKGMFKLVKIGVVVAIIYFAATYFGLL